jgi:hypothetical protein
MQQFKRKDTGPLLMESIKATSQEKLQRLSSILCNHNRICKKFNHNKIQIIKIIP